MSDPLTPPPLHPDTPPSPLASAEALALAALTAILHDPEASTTNKRLAACAILRHCASARAAEQRNRSFGRCRSGSPRATEQSSARCDPPLMPDVAAPVPSSTASDVVPSSSCPSIPSSVPSTRHLATSTPSVSPSDLQLRTSDFERTLSAANRLLDLVGTSRSARPRRATRAIRAHDNPATLSMTG